MRWLGLECTMLLAAFLLACAGRVESELPPEQVARAWVRALAEGQAAPLEELSGTPLYQSGFESDMGERCTPHEVTTPAESTAVMACLVASLEQYILSEASGPDGSWEEISPSLEEVWPPNMPGTEGFVLNCADCAVFQSRGSHDPFEYSVAVGIEAGSVRAVTIWAPMPTELWLEAAPTELTYAARVYDSDDNFADCLVWGHDPAGLTGGDYDSFCVNCPDRPDELRSCVPWRSAQ